MDFQSIELWQKRLCESDNGRNHLNVNLGVHLEEIGEELMELSFSEPLANELLTKAINNIRMVSTLLKLYPHIKVKIKDRENFLKEICDVITTGTGVALAADMQISKALAEVNSSNWSKFDTDGNPIFTKEGKAARGPNYKPANLRGLV